MLPVLSKRFRTIHDVADPHTMTTTSSCFDAHEFQKSANAMRKLERLPASQGNSSRKTMRLPQCPLRTPSASRRSRRWSKASNQSLGAAGPSSPNRLSARWNILSCVAARLSSDPVTENASLLLKVFSTRWVFPTRRLPYTQTSSALCDPHHSSRSACSRFLPMSIPMFLRSRYSECANSTIYID